MTIGLESPNTYYVSLLTEFPPRPISTSVEALALQNRMNTLLDRPQITEDDRDYLCLLGMLMFAYEERTEPMPILAGVELLEALIEEFELVEIDLLPIFGSQEVIDQIRQGKQVMSHQQNRALWILLTQLSLNLKSNHV